MRTEDQFLVVGAGPLGLGMAKAVFRVDMEGAPLGPTGADAVEFVLGPNVGEEALPLQRVASGGERARTLLALKGALADADSVPVQVFDEDCKMGLTKMEGPLRDMARFHDFLGEAPPVPLFRSARDCPIPITQAAARQYVSLPMQMPDGIRAFTELSGQDEMDEA